MCVCLFVTCWSQTDTDRSEEPTSPLKFNCSCKILSHAKGGGGLGVPGGAGDDHGRGQLHHGHRHRHVRPRPPLARPGPRGEHLPPGAIRYSSVHTFSADFLSNSLQCLKA